MAVSLRSSIAKRRSHLNAALCAIQIFINLVENTQNIHDCAQTKSYHVLFINWGAMHEYRSTRTMG
ncbi:hypothetical protein CGK43_22985 [Vibrio parahaemolyticus]|nr:hypothetical protein CGK43_22985 [Vibrio parahaemolyticus]